MHHLYQQLPFPDTRNRFLHSLKMIRGDGAGHGFDKSNAGVHGRMRHLVDDVVHATGDQ